jgi:transposase
VQSHFGHDLLAGHLYAFINRRGHQIQILFWDRNGLCIVKKRLEAGSFRLVKRADGEATHVEIDAADLALMFEGIELDGAKRRKPDG